jgi:hypothetical protein
MKEPSLTAYKDDKKEIPEVAVHSLGNYCDLVDQVTLEWRTQGRRRREQGKFDAEPFPGELSPWFRGCTESQYRCEPGLLRAEDHVIAGYQNQRAKIRQVEEYMFRRFRTAGLPLLERMPGRRLEWMFLMQHHGLQTRLIDWSKSSLAALYFAIRKHPLKQKSAPDAAVWMLEPRRLSESCGCGRRISDAKDHIVARYLKLDDEIQDDALPLPLIPAQVSRRLTAQRGRFTFHTHRTKGVETFAEKTAPDDGVWYVAKLVIPYECQPNMLRSLRTAGISETQITPDLDSVAREIRLRMELGLDDLSAKLE